MSSSDKFPDWSIFAKREFPLEVDLLSPVSEVAAILQRCQSQLEAAQKAAEEAQMKVLKLLAQQAISAVNLETNLERHKLKLEEASLGRAYKSLRIVKDQMLGALRDAGLEIIIPLGWSFDRVADFVDVVGWKHSGKFTEEVVAEVLEPTILYQKLCLHPGCVVMGAPLNEETESSVISEVKVLNVETEEEEAVNGKVSGE